MCGTGRTTLDILQPGLESGLDSFLHFGTEDLLTAQVDISQAVDAYSIRQRDLDAGKECLRGIGRQAYFRPERFL